MHVTAITDIRVCFSSVVYHNSDEKDLFVKSM